MQSIDERIRSYVPFFGKWYLNDPPEILGRGNSGTVYLVHTEDVDAALKVISIPKDDQQYNAVLKEMGGSVARVNAWIDQELRYARTEIQIMERLKSDSHIVCFEDAAVYPRTDTYGFDVIIRMERLVQLDTFLKTCDRYGFKRGLLLNLRIWSELVSGLSFCERCDITHLDVKPDNIFYAEPSRDYFKLGDFGVSIRSENGKKVGAGMIVGTRDYMAPEINAGEGGDIRSDMYSLAVVMYELFNDDKLPFVQNSRPTETESREAREKRLSGADIPPVRGMNPELWAIMQRCLRPNPNDRYPTMQALYIDLERFRLKAMGGDKPHKRSKLLPVVIGLAAAGAVGMAVLGVMLSRSGPTPTPGPAQTGQIETDVPDSGSNGTEPPAAGTLIAFERGFETTDNVGNGAQEYTYMGTTGPRREVSFFLNNRKIDTVLSEEDGAWSYTIEKEALSDNALNHVLIRLDDGAEQEDEFYYDGGVVLTSETDVIGKGKAVSGTTDAGAEVRLLQGGEVIARATADETGAYVLDMEADAVNDSFQLTAGEALVLQAVDPAGNTEEKTLTVVIEDEIPQDILRPMGVEMPNGILREDGGYLVNGDAGATQRLALHGTPDSAACLRVTLNGAAVEEMAQELTFDANGTTDVSLTFSEDGAYSLSFFYAEDTGIGRIVEVAVDLTAPSIELLERPEAMSEAELRVRTETGAQVDLADAAGNTLASTSVGYDGEARLGTHTFGWQKYTITASDAAGNRNSFAFWPSMLLRVDDIDTASTAFSILTVPGAEVSVSGADGSWMSQADEGGACVIGHDGAFAQDERYEVTARANGETETVVVVVGRVSLTVPITAEIDGLGGERAAGGSLRLSGTAQPHTEVTVSWNGADIAAAPVDADGRYDMTLSGSELGISNAGEEGTLQVRYTAGEPGEPTQEISFLWDGGVALSVDVPTEDSEYLAVHTDADAAVEIYLGAELAAKGNADENGEFTWAPEGTSFTLGETYWVIVTDARDNSDRTTVTVESAQRMPISVESLIQDGMTLAVAGSAQPDKTVSVSWNGRGTATGRAQKNGHFSIQLDAGSCGLPGAGEHGTIEARYADGIGEGTETACEYDWDAFVDLAVNELNEDDEALSGVTDPGAQIEISQDNTLIASLTADDVGAFSWNCGLGQFEAGAVYAVHAVDEMGNEAICDAIVGFSKRAPLTVAAEGLVDGVATGTTLTVSGTAEPNAVVLVGWQDMWVSAQAQNDGAYSLMLDAEELGLGGDAVEVTLDAVYGDGRGRSIAANPTAFVWDPYVALNVDALTQDSESLIIHTDANAAVEIYRSSDLVSQGSADENGEYIWTPEDTRFELGETYWVKVSDAAGNSRREPCSVETARRQAITLTEIAADGVKLVVTGEAEPGKTVSAGWNGGNEKLAAAGTDGRYTVRLDAEECGLPGVGEQGVIEVRYADGVDADNVAMADYFWDALVDLSIDPLTEDDSAVSGVTDPGAQVTVYNRDGEVASELTADAETGRFSWDGGMGTYLVGDTYSIVAQDAAGNVAQADVEVGESMRAQITVSLPDLADGVVKNEEMIINGTAEPSLPIQFKLNDMWTDGVPVAEDGTYSVLLYAPHWYVDKEGLATQVEVCYADGGGVNKTGRSEPFVWDPYITLELGEISEDSQSLTIACEPGTQITISNGSGEWTLTLDDSGRGEWAPDGAGFTAGETYVVRAKDPAGNEAEATVQVEETKRAAITASVAGVKHGILSKNTMTITGRAEPDAPLEVMWNGVVSTTFRSDTNGAYSVTLDDADYSLPSGGITSTLVVRYADGRSASVYAEKELTWDTWISLSTDNLTEDSDGISVHTDPYAYVSIKHDGKTIHDGYADGDGGFSLALSVEDLMCGMVYDVSAVDGASNKASLSVTVSESTRAMIEARLESDDTTEHGAMRSREIRLVGTAEPNVSLTAIDALDNVFGFEADDTGAFSVPFTAEQYALSDDGMEINYTVFYADGVGAQSGTRVAKTDTYLWDCTKPAVILDTETINAKTTVISGTTTASDITVSHNGEWCSISRGENGYFTTADELALAEGDTIVITAWDKAENGIQKSLTVERAPDWQIGEVHVGGEYDSTQTLTVSGWYACHGREIEGVSLSIRQNEVPVYETSAMSRTPLNANELAGYQASWPVSADVTDGYAFIVDVPLTNFEGEYTVGLTTFDIAEGVYLPIGDTATFTVRRVETEDESVVLADSYALIDDEGLNYVVGFDRPMKTYNGNDILLTGWRYGDDESRNYQISHVIIEYAGDEVKKRLAEVPLEDILDEEQGVSYLDRDVSSLPAEIRNLMPDIEPGIARSGYVIHLKNLGLPDGEYTIRTTTRLMGQNEGGSIAIRVQNDSGQTINSSIVDALTADWVPDEEETPAEESQ